MTEPRDYELGDAPVAGSEPPLPPPSLPPPDMPWLLIGVGTAALVMVAAFGSWLVLRPRGPVASPVPASVAPPTTAPVAEASPTTSPALPPLPPVDGTDASVRALLESLSPGLRPWTLGNDLVRTMAVVVDNVVEGVSPRRALLFLGPTEPFRVKTRGSGLAIDPACYARYDGVVATVAALDPGRTAQAYRALEPLLESAYHDLGQPRLFRAALDLALDQFLAVPVVQGDIEVVALPRPGPVYAMTDPRLEGLTAAQKHLLRMGPANVKRFQGMIRAFRAALGRGPEAPG